MVALSGSSRNSRLFIHLDILLEMERAVINYKLLKPEAELKVLDISIDNVGVQSQVHPFLQLF